MGLFLLLAFSACGGSSNPSTDATLSALSLSAGELEPEFASGTTNYALTTSSGSTTVTPTVNQANASVTVNSIPIASGTESAPLLLAVGNTVISVVVTAEDGTTTQTHTITITRSSAESNDAVLSGLTLSAGDIAPAFASGTASYTLATTSDTTTVTPTVNQADATVTVNGTGVTSGTASSSIDLAIGDTAISVVVTAEDGSTTQTYTVAVTRSAVVGSLELIDPTPGIFDEFGTIVVPLANGNIVVNDPGDDTVANNSGAVHLYSPFSSTPIASIYGDVAGDRLGEASYLGNGDIGITALGNSNYVIASRLDDEGGIVNAGSVRLMNGSSGVQIGATLVGDVTDDFLGIGGITALDNNNYVIASRFDDEGVITDAGSVRLVNGSTGVQIGATLTGDLANDQLGRDFIVALGNNNYVIASADDDENGIVDAGSVRLVDGSTGLQIGATLTGNVVGDSLGSHGITALGNNNFVIDSPFDDVGGIVNAGSVALVNGSTGVPIGFSKTGHVANDALGFDGITALGNNNYVIASSLDDEGGIVDAGSVILMDGSTGVQIGASLVGDVEDDSLGSREVVALGNNNYVIASEDDDENGIVNAGSVRLMDGSTGVQIGASLVGDVEDDHLSDNRYGITPLSNNNYVVASEEDDEGGIVDAGSVRLVDGSTGLQIGATISGDTEEDLLGNEGVYALGNNNFVIASDEDDEGGIVDASSVRLVDGTTGVQIGETISGDIEGDALASGPRSITALDNNNYVIASEEDDESGIEDAGSVRLVDGSTGIAIGGAIIGGTSEDMDSVDVIKPVSGNYYILSLPRADNSGLEDSGMVRIITQ